MGDISEASLLDYICSSGGKVKNSDLSKTYKHFINHSDLQLRAKYREEFKLIIDRIAVVKSENVSTCVLDPLEKEWIFSAASGKLSHLAQLLKQDSSLANKKTALHWAAKHGKEDMTTMLAEAGADINTKGYTPLHIAALHGHRHIFDLLVRTYGAKENLRDYSGHIAYHYLSLRETRLEDHELFSECHSLTQAGERRNRKITSLFHSMKKWGAAEELAPVPEERTVAHQLMLPAFRPRKFSR
uniref:SOWAHA-C winged helix-turn-helix domain-containing protein n=1 Tax=Sinocyclocheilus anshuiensis TaxID=1608454 RepID=A0A671QYJ5_9TELE